MSAPTPSPADIESFLTVLGWLWKVGGAVGAIFTAGWGIRRWVGKFKAGILKAVTSALENHEKAESKRFDKIDAKMDGMQEGLSDVRERLARIEGRMEVEPSKETKP